MIITKNSLVYFVELTPALLHMFITLNFMDRNYAGVKPTQLVITAISNGVHAENSRHYRSEAMDLRSNNFPSRESKREFRTDLEIELGPKFRVLLENEGKLNEHFHIQVKKGMTFNHGDK